MRGSCASELASRRILVPQPDLVAGRGQDEHPRGHAGGAAATRALRVAVLTGDIQTERDADRLKRYGFPALQITTGGTCHLDASMVRRALADVSLDGLDVLFIENVGNLVCPASYDLGEDAKVVVLSVAEGDDKPLKYPGIFRRARLMLLHKIDLLPYTRFNRDAAMADARRVNPEIEVVETSCAGEPGLTVAGLDRGTRGGEERTGR